MSNNDEHVFYTVEGSTMEIGSGNGYPGSTLSNFTPHPFSFRGIACASMEGLLQGLKFKNKEKQRTVFLMVGKQAKFAGKLKKWYTDQVLYFQGEAIARSSREYQDLLDEAFESLSHNHKFRAALLSTQNATLKHSIGKTDPTRTVLTVQEFISRLVKIRERIQKEMKGQ